ncbi:unnamed protein product [Acanthoscelides obtectus]|uniref:Uncharacterized protein n=1 Tax=Acanthoscelides obtectus TaxID=200917 RepID=A0A9P0M5Q9_ACAOB|nr:unnamed protein product [Acanthoscelides obtectus]CAK1656985.1 hypothetical protein AOBTE_LOCUS20059 [Acanthoscelides obtectus]
MSRYKRKSTENLENELVQHIKKWNPCFLD